MGHSGNETWFQKAAATLNLFVDLISSPRKNNYFRHLRNTFTGLSTPLQGQKVHQCTKRGWRFEGIPGPGIRPIKHVVEFKFQWLFLWFGSEFNSRTKFSKVTRGEPNFDRIHKRPIKSCSWWARLSIRLHYVDLTNVSYKAGHLEPMGFYEMGSH